MQFTIARPLSGKLPLGIAMVVALGLAACQSDPRPPVGLTQTPSVAATPAPSVPASEATFAFEPITGMPANKADELSSELGAAAGREGVVLVRRQNAKATYRINGYLSSTGDSSSTTVFYVFDIVDANGRRVNRLQGSETIGGTSGDPWAVVDTGTLQRIAQRAIVEIHSWVNRS